MEDIGHDGSEIINDAMPEPYNRRGFFSQECIETAMLKYNVFASEFQLEPEFATSFKSRCTTYMNKSIIEKLQSNFPGVLLWSYDVKRHALVWDTQSCFDPATEKVINNLPTSGCVDSFIAIGGVDVSRKFDPHF